MSREQMEAILWAEAPETGHLTAKETNGHLWQTVAKFRGSFCANSRLGARRSALHVDNEPILVEREEVHDTRGYLIKSTTNQK